MGGLLAAHSVQPQYTCNAAAPMGAVVAQDRVGRDQERLFRHSHEQSAGHFAVRTDHGCIVGVVVLAKKGRRPGIGLLLRGDRKSTCPRKSPRQNEGGFPTQQLSGRPVCESTARERYTSPRTPTGKLALMLPSIETPQGKTRIWDDLRDPAYLSRLVIGGSPCAREEIGTRHRDVRIILVRNVHCEKPW